MTTPDKEPRRADVLVVDGEIVAVGKVPACPVDEVVDADGMLVIPGFVDTHRHTWQSALRYRHGDSDFIEYRDDMLGTVGARYRPADVYVGNELGALAALDAGTTTLVDWSHVMNTPEHADAAIAGLRDSGIRAVFAHGWPRTDPAVWGNGSTEGHPKDIIRVRSEVLSNDDALVTLAMAARGPELASPSVVADDFALARELGIRTTMHVGAGPLGPRVRAVEAMAAARQLGIDLTLVHVNTSSDHELQLMADHGVSASIGPLLEAGMGGLGIPATGRLLERAVLSGLSGDTESFATADMFSQMRAALASARMVTNNALAESGRIHVTVAQVYALATRDGAEVAGLGARVGTIEVGKRADIVLLNAGVSLSPVSDALGAIVLGATPGNVDTVIVDGEIRKRAGKLTSPRLQGLLDRARASQEYLLQR